MMCRRMGLALLVGWVMLAVAGCVSDRPAARTAAPAQAEPAAPAPAGPTAQAPAETAPVETAPPTEPAAPEAAAVPAAPAPSKPGEEQSEPTFVTLTERKPVPGAIPTLYIAMNTGYLTVEGGPEDEVSVEARIRTSRFASEEDAAAATFAEHVRFEVRGDRVIVMPQAIKDPDLELSEMALKVRAPARMALTATMLSGDITVKRMSSDLLLSTMEGPIGAFGDTFGRVTALTQVGSVTLEARAITGSVQAATVTGDVVMSVEVMGGPVNAKTSKGDVLVRLGTLDGRVSAAAETGNVMFQVEAVDTGGEARLETTVGDVIAGLPAGSPGTFDLKVVDGQITLAGRDEIQVTPVDGGASAKGVVGQGGPRYHMVVQQGSVTIR